MITVVGGTYEEYCFEPSYKERLGSGLRACRVLTELSPDTKLEFHTFGNDAAARYLQNFPFQTHRAPTPFSVSFHYDHPLIEPRISPRLDTFDRNDFKMNVEGDNVLCYGFFEGTSTIKGNKVVYDPQSPVMPIPFSSTQSQAGQLAYVINIREASIIAGTNDLQKIKVHFFATEKVQVLVIKMGPKGALVVTENNTEVTIPVYKTKNVWPIGSGDVFAAVFAYYWFKDNDPVAAAQQASWLTACYCNYNDFAFSSIGVDESITQLIIDQYPTGQVYLAGPFFTFIERWLIEQARNSLLGMRLKVFSPLHEIGIGKAEDVVPKDIEAIENSAIVFAVVDGLDSGTLFEIGYAIKKGIPVIAYVENESSESIKMLQGTNCILEKDLTTAVYKCFWKLAENG